MREPSMGAMARTIAFLVAVVAIGGTTVLWQYLYVRLTLAEVIIGVLPTAAIGAIAAYYAVRG